MSDQRSGRRAPETWSASALRPSGSSAARLGRLGEITAVPASPATRSALEGVVALQARAAAILHANRRHGEAARAEQFAARARLMLDEPKPIGRMHALARSLYESSDRLVLLERALEGALSLIGGDFGNVQIREATSGRLRIAVQCGFGSEFLEYFEFVEGDTSACGRAASQRSQTVIADVRLDAGFAPHREIAAASRFRAVQSTPLIDATGRLRGVLSTHYRHSHRPSGEQLVLMQWYAEHVAAAIAERQNTTVGDGNGALQAQLAELHVARAARTNNRVRALDPTETEAKALAMQERARRAMVLAAQGRERAKALRERAQTMGCLSPSRSSDSSYQD